MTNSRRETSGIYKRKADGTGPEIMLVAGASEANWQPLCNLKGNDRCVQGPGSGSKAAGES